jgi:phage gp16-like protein
MSVQIKDNRNADLAKIHIAKKDLGMSEEDYRAMLWTVGRVKSSAQLDDAGRRQLLAHLSKLGWAPKPGKPKVLQLHERVTEQKRRLAWRIEQWLAVAEPAREESYADGMARKMFHVERVTFCTVDQLHRIVAALEIDGKRNGWSIDKGAKHEP